LKEEKKSLSKFISYLTHHLADSKLRNMMTTKLSDDGRFCSWNHWSSAFLTKDIIIMGMIKKEDAMCLHNV